MRQLKENSRVMKLVEFIEKLAIFLTIAIYIFIGIMFYHEMYFAIVFGIVLRIIVSVLSDHFRRVLVHEISIQIDPSKLPKPNEDKVRHAYTVGAIGAFFSFISMLLLMYIGNLLPTKDYQTIAFAIIGIISLHFLEKYIAKKALNIKQDKIDDRLIPESMEDSLILSEVPSELLIKES